MPLFGRETQQSQERAASYAAWLNRRNPLAIASLVLGVFSLIEFGALVVFGVAGIIVGAIALVQLRPGSVESQRRPDGQRLALAGIALSAISLAVAAVLYLLPMRAGGGGG